MKRSEIMKLPASDREKKMEDLQLELMKLRAQAATGTAQKASGRIRNVRKDIARLMTARGGKSKA